MWLKEDEAARLWSRCAKGDEHAWAELVRRYAGLPLSVARRNGLSLEEAEDVAQVVFLALYRNLHRIESGVALPRWLAIAATRESYRRTGKPTTISLEDVEQFREPSVNSETQAELEQAEASVAVRNALDELGDPCRGLLTLLYHEDEPSYQHVAQELQMPVGSIGPTKARCLEKLRKSLHARGLDNVFFLKKGGS